MPSTLASKSTSKGKGKGKGKGKATLPAAAPSEKSKAAVVEVPVAEEDSEDEDFEDLDDEQEGDDVEDGSEVDDDDDDEDSDGDEVDEAAMSKLMELLGDVDPYELGLEDDAADEDEEDEDDEDFEDEEDLESEDDNDEEEEDDDDDDLDAEDAALVQSKTVTAKTAAQKKQEEVLDRILGRFKLDVDFFETQTLTFPDALEISNVDDDLQRELQFYKQSLWGAQHAMKLFKRAKLPFTRPDDYYAEMLKS